MMRCERSEGCLLGQDFTLGSSPIGISVSVRLIHSLNEPDVSLRHRKPGVSSLSLCNFLTFFRRTLVRAPVYNYRSLTKFLCEEPFHTVFSLACHLIYGGTSSSWPDNHHQTADRRTLRSPISFVHVADQELRWSKDVGFEGLSLVDQIFATYLF